MYANEDMYHQVMTIRFTDVAERLLRGQTSVRVLKVLLRFPEREMTGRQVAGLAHAPPQRVIERLHELEWEGLVERRVVGRSHVWKLVEGHVLVGALAPLLQIDRASKRELRTALIRWARRQEGLIEARLFGSIARGDEKPASDIDLLLVVRDESAKRKAEESDFDLDKLVRRRFGNPVNVIVLTRREWRARTGRGFVGKAEAEGELLAAGSP
jgi:predicted nucleotidyltransferase